MSLFALVDCNNFYASCERVFQPRLVGQPVVVLSNNDGCIVARSAEAKALKIAMGAPFHFIQDVCRKNGVAVFSSNYTLYGDMSRRVMAVLRDWAPAMEIYSIDEAFLDVSGFPPQTLEQELVALRSRVRQWTGVPVSIGVGRTKTLAKVANRLAKKSAGVQLMLNEPDERAALDALPVGDLWGIGGRMTAHLASMNIVTAGQLRDASPAAIRACFNVVVERTVLELRGVSCLALEDLTPPRKSLMVSRSFGTKVTALPELQAAVATFACRAAEKLRQGQQVAEALEVFAQTSRFDKSARPYAATRTVVLPYPSSDSRVLVRAALRGLADLYRPGPRYAKVGVMLVGLSPAASAAPSLFAGIDRPSDRALMAAVDRLNRDYGRGAVRIGAARPGVQWSMRTERKSKAFTTRWDELATVR